MKRLLTHARRSAVPDMTRLDMSYGSAVPQSPLLRWTSKVLRPETPLYALGWFVAALIILLVIVILWSVFQEGLPSLKNIFQLSTTNFTDTFSSPALGRATLNTLYLGIGTTVLAIVIAIVLAWLIHRTTLRFKRTFVTWIFLTTMLPGFVRVLSWIMMTSPRIGMVNQLLRTFLPFEEGPLSPYNIPFMIFLQGLALAPIVFLMLGPAFMSIDPALEEAALTSGSSRFQVFRRVTLPLLRPSILGGAIFVFMIGISMFEVPALLGTPRNKYFLSTLMYEAIHPELGVPRFGVAGVYAILMLVPTLVALYFYQKTMRASHRYSTVTGKGYRPRLTNLGRWSWLGYTFIGLYFLLDLILPLLALIWTSLVPVIQLPSAEAFGKVSLTAYPEAFRTLSNAGAIWNTVILLVAVGLGAMLVGLTISWISVRTRMRGRYALDMIAMIPHAVPGVAVAFAVFFVTLVLAKYLPLYKTITAIIIADIIVLIPFNTRTLNATLVQIHPELEEAVLTSGASKLTGLRTVVMPLIAPALMYVFVWSILAAFRDVTLALFLNGPKNQVLSTVIWQQWTSASNHDVACATSVIMMAAMGVFIAIVMRVFPGVRKAIGQH